MTQQLDAHERAYEGSPLRFSRTGDESDGIIGLIISVSVCVETAEFVRLVRD